MLFRAAIIVNKHLRKTAAYNKQLMVNISTSFFVKTSVSHDTLQNKKCGCLLEDEELECARGFLVVAKKEASRKMPPGLYRAIYSSIGYQFQSVSLANPSTFIGRRFSLRRVQ